MMCVLQVVDWLGDNDRIVQGLTMVAGEEGLSTVVGAAGGAFTTPVAFMCGMCPLDRLMSSKSDRVGLEFGGSSLFTFAIKCINRICTL